MSVQSSVKPSPWSLYKDRRVLIMTLIGFSCGVPLFLTGSTFALWLRQSGISYATVSILGLVALPYTIKFVWAPFIDRLKIPYLTQKLGRRRSWLLISQVGLLVSIFSLAHTNPSQDLTLTILCALGVSFSSATQDVVMLAYQMERLGRNQYGAGEAMGIFGYRLGMLLSGAGALHLAEYFNWGQVYQMMGACISLGILTTLLIAEPPKIMTEETRLKEKQAREYLHSHPKIAKPLAEVLSWLYGAVVCPFRDFMTTQGWIISILIMLFYKLGDNLIGNMSNIFYTEIGFSKAEIANISKVFGMATTVLGGMLGGFMIARFGMIKSLFFSALVHGASILFFVALAKVGHNINLLYFSIAIEHITGGMRTTSLFAFQMTLVNPVYAATQLALLTSAVHLGRTMTAACSGWFVEQLGWIKFFSLSAASTFVSLGLVMLFWFFNKFPSSLQQQGKDNLL